MTSLASQNRRSELVRRVETWLQSANLRSPGPKESETRYTRDVLATGLERFLSEAAPGIPLRVEGDGFASNATPAYALGHDLYPDLAISSGALHLWAAEVKILRRQSMPGQLSKAVGQSALYRARYERVALILAPSFPVLKEDADALVSSLLPLNIGCVLVHGNR